MTRTRGTAAFACVRSTLLSTPLPCWATGFGVLAIAVNLVLAPEEFNNPWIALVGIANLACLVAVPSLPLPTWVCYLPLFLLVALFPDLGTTVFVFFAPLMAGLVAYCGHTTAAAWGCVLLCYAGTIDPPGGIFFPADLLATMVWAVLLAGPVLIGRILHQLARQRRDLVEQWQQDVRGRRETLARTLHDSVATSLTSIVMRAEALSLRRGIDNGIRDDLTSIADEARTSMQEVRSLLRILSEGTAPRGTTSELSVAEQLNDAAELLRAHGFTVAMAVDYQGLCCNADSLVAIRQILTEVVTNVTKYAERGSTVTIDTTDRDSNVVIGVGNPVRDGHREDHLVTGLGLPGISQLAGSIGGKITTISDAARWRTELQLPRTATH